MNITLPIFKTLGLKREEKCPIQWSERLVSLFIFLSGLPVILICMVIIKYKSPTEKVFYSEDRVVGYDSTGEPKILHIHKLRTMSQINACNVAPSNFVLPHDKRIDKFSNFLRVMRLDEWPQLWEVAKGNMHLFGGPRPRPLNVEKDSNPEIFDQWKTLYQEKNMRASLVPLGVLFCSEKLKDKNFHSDDPHQLLNEIPLMENLREKCFWTYIRGTINYIYIDISKKYHHVFYNKMR